MIRIYVAAALALLTGCFDSLLGTPCRAGFTVEDGACVVGAGPDAGPAGPDTLTIVTTDGGASDGGASDGGATDGGGDATDGGTTDGMVADAGAQDAPTCTADVDNDPMNCGACGLVCASGICAAGACLGATAGHVVAIGHDYGAANAPMLRVLGNAAAMGAHADLAIARWSPSVAVTQALTTTLAQLGRPWHAVALPAAPSPLTAVDVVLVDPSSADGDAAEAFGTSWRTELADFVDRGGVVIVLEGVAGTNYRFAAGASLFVSGPPVAATGLPVTVTAPTDSVAQQVVSPYAAAATSVAFPGLPAVIATATGEAVVVHLAVP